MLCAAACLAVPLALGGIAAVTGALAGEWLLVAAARGGRRGRRCGDVAPPWRDALLIGRELGRTPLTFNPARTLTVEGMDGYSISQMAERTGFPASTLRFYEQTGLVRPARTAAGYRSYDDSDLEVLSFIGRAKGFGLSLGEITEVLSLLDSDRCAPVQGRLRDLVDAKIVDAQGRIAELVAFTGELQRVASTLALNTPDGPCDDTCGCTTEPDVRTPVGVALSSKPSGAHEEPIVCTLAPEGVPDRLADWQAVLAGATTREPIDRGVRARFAGDVDVAGLAALAAAEQDCCRFFTFGLTIDTDGVALEITGPPDAQPVIAALVGTAA